MSISGPQGPDVGPGLVPLMPPHGRGQRIGLFGGSFNPPHDGHRLVSLTALKRLRLDAVWWLVTPGNPLKDNQTLPTLSRRIAAARAVAAHPRIVVTGLEARIGTRYTFDTIRILTEREPATRFVWLMGADNLPGFHRWQHWQDIARCLPIAVVDRPDYTLAPLRGRAARWLSRHRWPEADAAGLAEAVAPAFVFLHGPRSDLSSTTLRAAGRGLPDG